MTTIPTPTTPRTLPRGLAAIVSELELDQRVLVTVADLEAIRLRAGVATPAKALAARLRARGWLLPTHHRGVYEFVPGAHAGALSSGQVTLPLQSVLRARPELRAGLALQSAAWAMNLADRAPARLEVAAPDTAVAERMKRLLGEDARILAFAPRLPWQQRREVPTMAAESVLVHMAARPRDVRSWSSALEWLPDLAAELATDRLRDELIRRPAAVCTRTAYLLSGLRPDLAREVAEPGHGGVHFGSRKTAPQRHDAHLQVTDSLLPFDPRALASVAP